MATGELEFFGDTSPTPPKTCWSCNRRGEWPGQPCPRCRERPLEPVPLRALAEHLRDQQWLDLHVDDPRGKIAKRVRLTSIIVRQHDEVVTCRQEWVVTDGDEVTGYDGHELSFDADAIWKVTPTAFTPETLAPYGRSSPRAAPLPRTVTDDIGGIVDRVVAATSYRTGFSAPMIRTFSVGLSPDLRDARYVAMAVLHDITTMPDMDIATCFGYKSVTPVRTARFGANKARAREVYGDIPDLVARPGQELWVL